MIIFLSLVQVKIRVHVFPELDCCVDCDVGSKIQIRQNCSNELGHDLSPIFVIFLQILWCASKGTKYKTNKNSYL